MASLDEQIKKLNDSLTDLEIKIEDCLRAITNAKLEVHRLKSIEYDLEENIKFLKQGESIPILNSYAESKKKLKSTKQDINKKTIELKELNAANDKMNKSVIDLKKQLEPLLKLRDEKVVLVFKRKKNE